MVIDGGLEIKKEEKNQFGTAIIQYFFFLRLNPHKDLEEYKLSVHGMNCAELVRDNYKLSN